MCSLGRSGSPQIITLSGEMGRRALALVPPYAFPQDKCPEAADAFPWSRVWMDPREPCVLEWGLPRPGPPEPQCSPPGGADDGIHLTHRHGGRTQGLQKLFAKVRRPLQAGESCGVKNPGARREEVSALHPLSAVCSPMGRSVLPRGHLPGPAEGADLVPAAASAPPSPVLGSPPWCCADT